MGLFLNTTSAQLQVVTTTSQVLHVSCDTVDMANGATTVSPVVPQNTIINSSATTSIAGSPAASTSRAVASVSIQNTDVASVTITVQRTDGTTTVKIKTLTLPAGYSYCYESKEGWYVQDNNGNFVVDNTQVHGLFIKSTVVLNGTTSFVLSGQTNTIRVRLRGGGGAGGGCPATLGNNGGGGSSGGLALWTVGVTPGSTLTCAVGAGGTGVSAANGNAGGATTLTVGGTTCTANGGLGGPVGVATNSTVGAASPAVSTNGTFNTGGCPGEDAMFGATGHGGNGGSCDDGGGGLGKAPPTGTGGAASVGFGGGGGGGMNTTAAAQVGGAGANGVLIIDEYT